MAANWPRPAKRVISGNKARQGEIILRTPLQRAVFIAGLAGAVILAIAIALWAYV
jgi:hypothetical protein